MSDEIESTTKDAAGLSGGTDETPSHESDAATSGGGTASRYKDLEEADRAARSFQSDRDKLAAQFEQVKRLIDGERIRDVGHLVDVVRGTLSLASRDDWNDYVSGTLKTGRTQSDEEEFLTDEQKEIRELRNELKSLRGESQRAAQSSVTQMIEYRVERAEDEARRILGSDVWDARKDETISRIRQMASRGVIQNPSDVTGTLLVDAFITGITDPEEKLAAMEKIVEHRQTAKAGREREAGTTVPAGERTGAKKQRRAKSLSEAIQFGQEDHAEAERATR